MKESSKHVSEMHAMSAKPGFVVFKLTVRTS